MDELAVGTILHLSGLKVEVGTGQGGQEFDKPVGGAGGSEVGLAGPDLILRFLGGRGQGFLA